MYSDDLSSNADQVPPLAAPAKVIEDGRGWQARLSLGYQHRGNRTVLAERHRQGPLAIQRSFHPEGPVCHNYLLHPPGGIVGGDQLQIGVDVSPRAHALITAPGAAKIYRSAGPIAGIKQTLRLAPGATLEWLPQENILFPGARVELQTRIELSPGSRFIGWEVHCLGRPVIGEAFNEGHALLGLELYRDQRPLLVERLRVAGEQSLNGAAGLRGHPITATLIATPATREHLSLALDHLQTEHDTLCAATLVDDVLLIRHLGNDAAVATRQLRELWALLRKPLLGVGPCPPRIWAT